jgi:hypothetical protein
MRTLYVDVEALLRGGLRAPEPTVLPVSDDVALFYSGEFNLIFGDTESGKTWLCMAAVVSTLEEGGKAAIIDLDHNGAQSIVNRLVELGAQPSTLTDTARFRLAEPTDPTDLKQVVQDLTTFQPDVVTIDSLGEVLPLFRGNSNNADDFTLVHACVIKPLALQGAAVLVVDHLAKNAESRAQGPTGTMAKTRAVGGLAVRVTAQRPFRPGEGGTAKLELHKDRHGGVRKQCPSSMDARPIIGTFELLQDDGFMRYEFQQGPATRPRSVNEEDPVQVEADIGILRAQFGGDRPTVRQAREALQCSNSRASRAVRQYDLAPGEGPDIRSDTQ